MRKLDEIPEDEPDDLPFFASLGLVQFGCPLNFSHPIISKLDSM